MFPWEHSPYIFFTISLKNAVIRQTSNQIWQLSEVTVMEFQRIENSIKRKLVRHILGL